MSRVFVRLVFDDEDYSDFILPTREWRRFLRDYQAAQQDCEKPQVGWYTTCMAAFPQIDFDLNAIRKIVTSSRPMRPMYSFDHHLT